MTFSGTLEAWTDVLLTSAATLFNKLAGVLPNLLGALFLLFLGWLVARLCKGLARKVLKWVGFDRAMEKSRVNEALRDAGVQTSIGNIIALVVFWSVFLVFILSASEVLGLSVVLETFNRLLLYVPNIIGAIAIIVLSLLVARIIKDFVSVGLAQVKMIYAQPVSRAVEILIIIFGLIVALTQLGFDIGVLMANITIFIAGFVAIVVLSLGLGAKTVVENLLAGYYIKQMFEEDQEVILAGDKGKIKAINNISIVMETEEGEMVIPNHKVIEQGSFK